MSWSSAKPRRRPRRQSFCFRSLWWLIEREAAWVILAGGHGYTMAAYTRRGFAMARRYDVRKLAETMLEYHPERRWVS